MADESTLSAMALQQLATISEDDARAIIDELMGIIRNPKATYRSKTSAARVLLQCKRLNLEAIKTTHTVEMDGIQQQLDELEQRVTGGGDEASDCD